MVKIALIALALVAANVMVHAAGLTALMLCLKRRAVWPDRFWPTAWLLVGVCWTLLGMHLVEITIWALFYHSQGCLADFETALYFSGVTYATVGYGDVVLPQPWRLLGPVEGLAGILLCGLSTAFFFAVISRMRGLPRPVGGGRGPDERRGAPIGWVE